MSFLAYLKTRYKLIGGLILGGIIMTAFVCDSCFSSPVRYLAVASYCSVMWIAMWLGNEYITLVLDEKIPWTKQPVKRFSIGVVAIVLYSFGGAFIIARIFEGGFNLYVGGFDQVYVTVVIAVAITLIMTSHSFLVNWRQTAIDAERLAKESIAARYENLKSQVNPHFLFNSLNALSNLVYEDQDKAVKFIKQLSEVYRYVLDTRDQEVVPVDDELRFLESYIFLQQIRFGDKLRFSINIDNRNVFLAPLALQMLIENAIKHNVISQEDPLSIKVYNDHEYIIVENNLQKKTNLIEPSSSLGLENICNRYEVLTSKKVEIIETPAAFTVKLPVLNNV